MKRILSVTLFSLLITAAAYAQPQWHGPDRGHDHMERIHAIKVAYITDKLHLSSEQSAKFWPVYDDYEQETHHIRDAFFQKYKNNNKDRDIDKREAFHYIEDDLDYQEQIIQLKRKYNDRFLKILSTQQVADLYRAEREFKEMLLQQLKERHNGGGWNGPGGHGGPGPGPDGR
jgi:Spy/CpxP family protein refolding chaperone